MFEGRWRIKSEALEDTEIRQWTGKHIKELCQDFFEAGFLLADGVIRDRDGFVTSGIKFPDGSLGTITTLHDPIIDSFDDGFEEWWNMYDLKCNRSGCEKKWSKLTPKEQADCIAATPAYVASTPDKQFRKRPLTYLNQKAFYDEIIIRHTPEQQRQQRLTEVAERIAGYTKAAK